MYVEEEYPKAILDLAKRRVKELMEPRLLQTQPLEKLLMSAYLQGIRDVAETFNDKLKD